MREGKCHMSMGEASAAVRSYQVALQLDPQSAAAQREVSWPWTTEGGRRLHHKCN